MDTVFQSIFIGAVQGIAEFLPISSSGHLVILPYIFDWDYKGLTFDIALHLGTTIAIIAYFWRDWICIITNGLRHHRQEWTTNIPTTNNKLISSSSLPYRVRDRLLKRGRNNNYPKNLLWQILVASIPAGIAGFLLNDYVESSLHSPLLIAFNLVVFGLILWLVDKKTVVNNKQAPIGYRQYFLIGLAQAISLVPGVSRSGITMTAARAQGMDRETSARFSFLLSTPAVIGASLLTMKNIGQIELNFSFWAGMLSAIIFGFLAIKYLLQYLKKSDFTVFLWYRIAIAIIVMGIYFMR